MNILIIGGTGTISKGIADAAIEKGYDVTLLNRGNLTFRNNPKCKIIVGDFNKLHELDQKLGVYDVLVDPLTFSKQQLESRLCFFKKHCKLYVFISSVAAIGASKEYTIQDEKSPKNPIWTYGVNKLACEELLKNQTELNYTIQRPSITYGDIRIPIPVSCRKNPYTVIDRIINNRPLVCFTLSEDPCHKHKLMDVSDFGKYSVALLDKEKAKNNDYIICSDNAYSWNEAYEYLYDKLNKPQNIYEVSSESFKIINPALYEDIIYDKDCKNVLYTKEKCKTETQLNLKEKSLQEGINDSVEYLIKMYKNQPHETDYNYMTDYILLHIAKKDEKLKEYLATFSDDYIKTLNIFYKNKLKSYKKSKSLLYKGLRKIKQILARKCK